MYTIISRLDDPSNPKFNTTTGQTVELGKPAREVSPETNLLCKRTFSQDRRKVNKICVGGGALCVENGFYGDISLGDKVQL